jgi:U32 family peptidase
MKKRAKILSPFGSYAALSAAIEAGADGVYFGIGDLHMRKGATQSFQIEDLDKIVSICKEAGVQSFVTLNVIVYDEELLQIHNLLDKIKESKADAVIASDWAVIQYAKSIGLPVHVSTQANVSNIDAVKFFAPFADTIVLARELTLAQISSICQSIEKEKIHGPNGEKVQIEIFAHGALCVAVSGKCHMSQVTYGLSANRGECLQPCRHKYLITDEETGNQLSLSGSYVLSPKDLCTLGFLDQLVDAGVDFLKIEGRGRSPEYVYTVTKVYKEALDSVYEKTFSLDKVDLWMKELKKVFHRDFWQGGYYLGKPLEKWADTPGSKATQKKKYVGKVTNFFQKTHMVEAYLTGGSLQKNDQIYLIGPKTGVIKGVIEDVRFHPSRDGKKGLVVTFPMERARKNDEIYLIENIHENEKVENGSMV